MTRVGAIDCGTNSIRLLIADVDGDRLTDVVRTMQIVRLGQGVDVTGQIAPEAMDRTLAAAADYARQCGQAAVDRVRFVATSASRDASNAAQFIAGVQAAFADFQIAPEVISGAEEAALSFLGATGPLRAACAPAPYLVVDLGGGSTEFVRGSDQVDAQLSTDIGCVRMTERHLRADPPTPEQVAAASADITAAIERAAQVVDFAPVRTLVGLAGSVTTVTAHALRLPRYDSAAIHGTRLPVTDVIASCTELLGMTRAQRAALGFMHPGRVDVIGAGALIWRTIVRRAAQDAGITQVLTSESDILDGIALDLAAR